MGLAIRAINDLATALSMLNQRSGCSPKPEVANLILSTEEHLATYQRLLAR